MGPEFGDVAEAQPPLQIPPTRPPKRQRKPWSRRTRIVAVVGAVLAVAVTASTVVDREVNRRLATLPVLSTTSTVTPTTTSIPPRPQSPKRLPRTGGPLEATTTTLPATTTTVTVAEVAQETYDIITKLDKLPVREERNFGYARYRFGEWKDEDGDGCTVRDDAIAKQALTVVRRTQPCRFVSGEWLSPYDNASVVKPDEIVGDHLVGLAETWRSGAWQWDDSRRVAYLNDVTQKNALLAVSLASQTDKDGRDPSEWLPIEEFRCTYLQTWVDLKTFWKLAVDAGERESIAAAALSC